MAACTDLKYKFYNGGWSSWKTSLSGGYAGSSSYVTALSFKTPSISKFNKSTSLSITIPFVRQSWASTTGTIYIKLYTSDPTTGSLVIPTSSTCDASAGWNTSSTQVQLASFIISSTSLKADTSYYLLIGASKNFIEIGYTSSYDSKYDINLNYSTYTDGTAPTIVIADQGNNICLISGVLGKNGTNNAIKSATLYYTTNGKEPNGGQDWTTKVDLTATSEGAYSKPISIPSGCTKIWAVTYCKFEYNTISTGHRSASVKFRYGPIPGKPTLSYKKSRLTIKENLTFSWAKPIEDKQNYLPLSCLKGYRIRLLKNDEEIAIASNSDGKWFDTFETTNELLHGATFSNGDTNKLIFDPAKFGFAAQDTLKLVVHGLYIDGNNKMKWSGSNDGISADSDTYTFENAGIVHAKVAGTWREAQVWVKAAGTWHEAETVNTKVSTWKESQ